MKYLVEIHIVCILNNNRMKQIGAVEIQKVASVGRESDPLGIVQDIKVYIID